MDADNFEYVKWVSERAQQRANEYGIKGIDIRLTLGVLKNIIPAVASTNAIIAGKFLLFFKLSALILGSCALETLKFASKYNYFTFNFF